MIHASFPDLRLLKPFEKRLAARAFSCKSPASIIMDLHGDLADESTPPGDDFLAQLTVKWEDATKSVEDLGCAPTSFCAHHLCWRKIASFCPLMALAGSAVFWRSAWFWQTSHAVDSYQRLGGCGIVFDGR
jgi:hypothetical protein